MKINKPMLWFGAAVAPVALLALAAALRPADDVQAAPGGATLASAIKREPPGAAMALQHVAAGQTAAAPGNIGAVELTVRTMRARGASEREVYQLRAAALSNDTALRLSAMETAELVWQSRIDAYLVERDLLASAAAEASEAADALAQQQLRDAHFSTEEQGRLDAFLQAQHPQLTLH